jgi:hypothetical protein
LVHLKREIRPKSTLKLAQSYAYCDRLLWVHQQPSYRGNLDRLVCEVKQPLILQPGERSLPANSRLSIHNRFA